MPCPRRQFPHRCPFSPRRLRDLWSAGACSRFVFDGERRTPTSGLSQIRQGLNKAISNFQFQIFSLAFPAAPARFIRLHSAQLARYAIPTTPLKKFTKYFHTR